MKLDKIHHLIRFLVAACVAGVMGGVDLLALSAVASPADKNDPREAYSTDGWKLAWSEEFNGKVVPAAKFPMEMKIDYVRYYTKGE